MPKDFNPQARGSKKVVLKKAAKGEKQPQKRIKNKDKYLPKGNKQKPKKQKIKNEQDDLKRKRENSTTQEGNSQSDILNKGEPVSKKPMRRDREMEGKLVTADMLDHVHITYLQLNI